MTKFGRAGWSKSDLKGVFLSKHLFFDDRPLIVEGVLMNF